MNFVQGTSISVVTAAVVVVLQTLSVDPAPKQVATTERPPTGHNSESSNHTRQFLADLNDRFTRLERRIPLNGVAATAVGRDDLRELVSANEAQLLSLVARLESIEQASAALLASSIDEEFDAPDDALFPEEDEVLSDEYAMRLLEVVDYHEAELEGELKLGQADASKSAHLSETVNDHLVDDLLGASALIDTECSASHCRLEFTHDDSSAYDALTTNLPLILPHGTSTRFVPQEDGVGTTAYLTLAEN